MIIKRTSTIDHNNIFYINNELDVNNYHQFFDKMKNKGEILSHKSYSREDIREVINSLPLLCKTYIFFFMATCIIFLFFIFINTVTPKTQACVCTNLLN